MMTGQPLKWEVVSGKQARAEGHPTADLETEWLKVYLARPVPKGGEGRVLIDKTDKDAKSYFRDGDTIVFDRSLGIRHNAVVLPVSRCACAPPKPTPTPIATCLMVMNWCGTGIAVLREHLQQQCLLRV